MRIRFLAIVVALCLALVAAPGEATDNTVNLGDLNIFHREGEVENITFRSTWPKSELAEKMTFEIRNTEKVQIVIVDPNPLLFTYTFDGITTAATEDFQNAEQFAGALAKLGEALGGVPAAAESRDAAFAARAAGEELDAAVGEELSLSELGNAQILANEALQSCDSLEECRAARILAGVGPEELTPAQVDAYRMVINQMQTQDEQLERIRKILREHDITSEFFNNLGTNVSEVSKHAGALGDLIERTAGDRKSVERVKEEVEKWALPELAQDLYLAFEKLDDAELDLLKATGDLSREDFEKIDPRLFALLIAKDQEAKIRELLETLESFADDVASIDVPLVLGSVSYTAGQISTAKLTITLVEANASAATKTGRKTGTFALDLAPRTPVRIGFGAALVYSFVEKPEFGTETEGDVTRIVRKDEGDEYVAQNVAATITLTPRGWFDPEFGAGFFLGVAPKKDEIGFYLGAGIRLYRLVNLGFGFTYQEVPRLTDGLKVGDEIDTPEDLKLDTEFKSGWFLSMNVKFR